MHPGNMLKTGFVVCATVVATSVIMLAGIPGMVVYRSTLVHCHCGVPHLYTGAAVYTSVAAHTFAMVYKALWAQKTGPFPAQEKPITTHSLNIGFGVRITH
eukprot:1936757-Pyramimonas_sp.AAC.1